MISDRTLIAELKEQGLDFKVIKETIVGGWGGSKTGCVAISPEKGGVLLLFDISNKKVVIKKEFSFPSTKKKLERIINIYKELEKCLEECGC